MSPRLIPSFVTDEAPVQVPTIANVTGGLSVDALELDGMV